MDKVLIICGPTASGKTQFALEIAQKFNGELVSADSRQVYRGMDIITGKGLPSMAKPQASNLKWNGMKLQYYIIQGIKVWLYDVVNPDEEFNVSFWHTCAQIVIADILSRGQLPIVVGGTGLYIKSLTHSLADISILPNAVLRHELASLSTELLFVYLKNIDLSRANSMNESDRKNPRRLIRAIEIAKASPAKSEKVKYDLLLISLKMSQDELFKRIDESVINRIAQGARSEYALMRQKYDPKLPSMTASGYLDWDNWALREKQYARRQLTWFKKQPQIQWLTPPGALKIIETWYN